LTISLNQKDFLEACIQSVRNQGFDDYEHIIIDPGSTDGSREWVSTQSDPRLRLIEKKDNGPAQGLNNGLDAAVGTIVLYLNSDDELPPHALRQIVSLHDQNPTADAVIGNGWTIDSEGKPLAYIRSDRFSPFRYSLKVATVLQQATSFKRRIFDRGLRFNESNRVNWDTELLFDLYDMGASVCYVPNTLGYFRLQPDSITMSGSFEARLNSQRETLYARGRGHVPRFLIRPLSLLARLGKKLFATFRSLADRPSFPGSASHGGLSDV
jgi:glycosyltransferase involved in cell wall biosynthesis